MSLGFGPIGSAPLGGDPGAGGGGGGSGNITLTGIASAEAFGTQSVSNGILSVSLTGIASAEAFGTATVSAGGGGGGDNTISHVDTKTATGGGGYATIDPWPTTQVGDLIIASVTWDGDMSSFTVPDGWTTIRKSAGNPPVNIAVFYRFATGSEPSSETFSSSGMGSVTAIVTVLRGADDPEASSINTGTMSTNLVATGVTTLGTNRWIVGCWSTAMAAITVPGSMTERGSAGTVDRSQKLATELVAAEGATGNRTATSFVMAEYTAVLVSVPPIPPSDQNITLTGIASAAAFGTQLITRFIEPSGIASAEAFGTPLMTMGISLTGIASAEAFGTHTLSATANIALTGIASAEAFGTSSLAADQNVTLTGIASAEAFGTPLVTMVIEPTGIASAEAFGTQDVSSTANVSLTGIASAEAFGVPTISSTADIALTGIPSAEAFGTSSVDIIYSILATGIASAEAFGEPTVVPGTAGVSLTGIASAEAFGQPTISINIDLTGIPSSEEFGTSLMTVSVVLAGIASAEVFGEPTVVPGTADVALTGITSAEAFGTQSLAGSVSITLTGIASAEAFGTQTTGRMAFLTGIASAEAFGTQTVAINLGGENTIVYVDTKTATGNGEATVNPWPTTQAGDLIIASLVWDGDMSTFTVPDGWTTLKKSAGNPPVGLAVFYRFATSSEPASVTFSSPSMMGDIVVAITVLRSAEAPEASSINTNTNTTDVVASSVTALGTNRWLLAAYGTGMAVLTAPGSMTERANVATFSRRLLVATEHIPNVGATGSRTATKVVQNDSEAILIAIPPAPPPGQPITLTGIASTAAFGTQTVENIDKEVFLTGITSAAAFGTQTVSSTADISLTGIPSAEAFGTPLMTMNISLTGIPSAEAFGTQTLSTTVDIALTGIPSAETFGTQTLGTVIEPTGIASAETFGTQTMGTVIEPTGIASAEAFGTQTMVPGNVDVTLTGIASTEAFGSPIASAGAIFIVLEGITSAETFGTQTLSSTVNISLTGIASAEAFGSQTMVPGNVDVTLTGIASAEAFGTPLLIGNIQLTGIESAETFGTAAVTTSGIRLNGIESAEAFGTATVASGTVAALTGIVSAEAFGSQTVTIEQSITLTGIASAEAFGTQVVTREGVVALTGIGSAETFGTQAVGKTIEATTSMSSESSLSATGIILKIGSVLVEGSTAVTLTGNVIQGSSATVPCSTTIIASGAKNTVGIVNAQAISAVVATATVISAPITGSAALGCSSSMSGSGVIIHYQNGSVLIGGKTTVTVEGGVSSVGNVYNPGNLGGLFLFFAPLVGAENPQDQTFVYKTKNGGTIVVKCPASPTNAHPCVPGSPVSEEQARYEEAAKASERLQQFAQQNNIDYFNNQCWVP